MATIKEVLQEKFERDELKDIAKYGCSGGVSGFIYYSETSEFYDEHKDEIYDMLEEYRQEFGHKSIPEFIASLNGAENVGSEEQHKNLLVWFAVEETARKLVNY